MAVVDSYVNDTEVKCQCGNMSCTVVIHIDRSENNMFTLRFNGKLGPEFFAQLNKDGLRELRDDLNAFLGDESDRTGG